MKQLAHRAPYYISAYPNAGLPNSLGAYDETPESMAPQIQEFIDEGLVNIIGGCCGTTEKFIAKYVPIAEGKKPHVPQPKPQTMWLSDAMWLVRANSFDSSRRRATTRL